MIDVTILGLISGSSLDGLDIGLCIFSGSSPKDISWQLLRAETIPFDEQLSSRLKEATMLSAKDLLSLEVVFSEFCADAVRKFCESENYKVDYIASHGHTVFHFPQEGYTLQIGKGSIIAEHTGVPCITDFRANDIALGGEGAPVAPIVEQWLYPGYDFYFNLGGIANLSYHADANILSIDSCPCNQVLNHVMNGLGKSYDDKGALARTGKVHAQIIDSLSGLKYFSDPIPKSMDNGWVQDVFIPKLNEYNISERDQLATIVAFIAIQLSKDVAILAGEKPNRQARGLATGGGAFNDYLIERLRVHFRHQKMDLEIPDHNTINFKEAILIALMGYLRVQRISNVIPSVTGASRASVGGAIYWA